MAGFGGGKCDEKDGDMSDGTVISCGRESSDRGVLHTEGKQA